MTAVTDPLVEPAPPLGADAVEAAADRVRDYCGWHIAPSAPETITLDGPGGRVLILPTLQLTAVASIVVDGTVVASTAYTWSPGGVLRRTDGGFWSSKPRGIVANVTHGYTVCPAAVRDFVEKLAAAGANASPITQAQVGQVAVTYGSPTPSWSALDPYRLVA